MSTIIQERSPGSSSGQVILEYVLLLVVALLIASILMRNFVGHPGEDTGIRGVWQQLVKTIGADIPDDPTTPAKPTK